jgi:hypothetical protein
MRGGAQIVARRQRLGAEALEDIELQIECAIAGVKRTWPASVWRWMKVAFSGGDISLSPCCAVTSTK